MVDSTYLLPSLGISVKSLQADDIELISRHREKVEFCYPAPLIAELLAKAAKEALKKKLKGLPEEACEGFKSLLAGLGVAVELPTAESLALAAELWIKGHRDIMDNLAYAHAVKSQAYFMTLDEAFKGFLSEKGYPLKFTATHKDLEKITQTSS